jgi:uncharacterized Zn ribbon protein
METLRTLTACKNCGKGYPYRDLVNGLCKECVSKLSNK